MTKEQEIMNFLHEKVFDPILNSKNAPANIKSGVNLTIGRMNKLSAEKMVPSRSASCVCVQPRQVRFLRMFSPMFSFMCVPPSYLSGDLYTLVSFPLPLCTADGHGWGRASGHGNCRWVRWNAMSEK